MSSQISDSLPQLKLTIEEAAQKITQGGVVAIPTETVYGLAADASQPEALKRIFSIKARPADHPLIVHIGSIDQIKDWARDIPEMLWPLAKRFWPGPLTVILKKQPHVSEIITGGQDTIALRIPNHPKALQLLVALKCGLAAPSANSFGRVSPTSAQHVIDELGDDIDGIVDGGDCTVGIESTILDLSVVKTNSEMPKILRPGQICQQAIQDCIGSTLSTARQQTTRAPGMLKAHYAPQTPLLLLKKSVLESQLKDYLAQGLKVNLWSVSRPIIEHDNLFWQQSSVDSGEFARKLYHQLRLFDSSQADITLIQRPQGLSDWEGVLDRLERAGASFSQDIWLNKSPKEQS